MVIGILKQKFEEIFARHFAASLVTDFRHITCAFSFEI